MEKLKGLMSKQDKQRTGTSVDDDPVPHLVPKPKQHKKNKKNKTSPNPPLRYIQVAVFHNSELPNIVFRPATPPICGPKIEDVLFDRVSANFVLRKLKVRRRRYGKLRSGVEHLKVPTQHRTSEGYAQLLEDKAATSRDLRSEEGYKESTEVSGQDGDVVESENQDVNLHHTSQLDYCKFIAGLGLD
jgi:hypothetical protein